MTSNLPPEAAAALLCDADRLFDAGDREAAAPLYAQLAEAGSPPAGRVIVRHAEALLQAGQAVRALAILRDAEAVGLDAWGSRALAEAESQAGDRREALALAAAALAERPDDPGFVTTYMEVQQRHGDVDSWREGLAGLGHTLPAPARHELGARLALALGRPAEAEALLADEAVSARDRLYYLALQTAYAALEAGDAAVAERLAGRLEQAGPNELPAILLRTELALHRQAYDEAAACLRRVPAGQAGLFEVRLKWFELACFTGDASRARNLLAGLEANGPLPRTAVPSVLRFLAEQQDWDAVVTRALGWLERDFSFGQIGYVLFRAARRTGRARELLSAIERVQGWRDHAELARLHTALAWDGARSLDEMERVMAAEEAGPAMRHRMAVQHRVMARARPGGRRALFLCTDTSFLCATLVALHGALERVQADAFLVVPDVLAETLDSCAARFRAAGHTLSIVPAGAILPSAQDLNPAYGLFTSGLVLSPAAYWRIFFARHLHRLGTYGRALYLDGDVLVRRALAPLFVTDLHGHALGARVEKPRPEVARATALHGLANGAYFNSGVLLFDMTHPRLAEALDRAAASATDERVPKLFHDQCALNLGFRGLFQPLPTLWNTPVAERAQLVDLSEDAAILHFLERPKPWSAAYDGPLATLWFDSWARTADLIGAEAATCFLGMAGE